RSPHQRPLALAQVSKCDSIHILLTDRQIGTRRRERTNWWWLVNRRRTVASPATRAAKAFPPSNMYITTNWRRMAWVADAPARIIPVMAPGRATKPTTLVWSIVGSIAVRMAARCHGAAA